VSLFPPFPPVFQEGTVIRFDTTKTPFTSIEGVVVNPDEVIFAYVAEGEAEVSYTWVNPSGDPDDKIENDGVGFFHVDIPTLGLPGNWTFSWYGKANNGPDLTGTTVKWESTLVVNPSVTS
jgi:hypothetical protein